MTTQQPHGAILTSSKMREADRYAIETLGFPSSLLMENAARSIFDEVVHMHHHYWAERDPSKISILILCGSGNNGGDGLAVARHASIQGYQVEVILAANEDRLSDDAALQLELLGHCPEVQIHKWSSFQNYNRLDVDLIIDGLLGTGAHGPLRSPYDEILHWIETQKCRVLAIDIPTGLDSDTGFATENVVRADVTVTLAAYKPGLFLGQGPDVTGRVAVGNIGTPAKLYLDSDIQMINTSEARKGLPTIARKGHKYDRGTVLVIGGSREMTGASIMTATAAMKSGAGLVRLALDPSTFGTSVGRIGPEIIVEPLKLWEEPDSEESLGQIYDLNQSMDVLAIGPGLGRTDRSTRLVQTLLEAWSGPIILDADGIRAFDNDPEHLQKLTERLVITPHHGELSRLIGRDVKKIDEDTLEAATEGVKRTGAITVLKGAPTVVARPDGKIWINRTGNRGMAKAGTGDVLTGIIAGLVAGAKPDALGAAVLTGVFLHSLAADIYVEENSLESLVATDIIHYLPKAFSRLHKCQG